MLRARSKSSSTRRRPATAIRAVASGSSRTAKQGRGQCLGVARRDEPSRDPVLDQLRHAAHARRDHGDAAGHRLHERHRDALGLAALEHDARLDDDIGRADDRHDLVARLRGRRARRRRRGRRRRWPPRATSAPRRPRRSVHAPARRAPVRRAIASTSTACPFCRCRVATIAIRERALGGARRGRGARHEDGRVDAAVDDLDPVRGRAVPVVEPPAVRLRDRDDERRARDLLAEHRAVDVDVVGVRGEAVGPAAQPADHPGRERRVRGPVGVDVVHLERLDPARHGGRARDDEDRAREELRRAQVAGDRPDPRLGEPSRPASRPVPLRRQGGARPRPDDLHPLDERRRPRLHRRLALVDEREQRDVDRPAARARSSRTGRTSPTTSGSARRGTRPAAAGSCRHGPAAGRDLRQLGVEVAIGGGHGCPTSARRARTPVPPSRGATVRPRRRGGRRSPPRTRPGRRRRARRGRPRRRGSRRPGWC